jgi:predicted ATPase
MATRVRPIFPRMGSLRRWSADIGVAMMLDGAWHPNSANRRSYMLGVIANAQIEAGQLEAAFSNLEGALIASKTLGTAVYDAEIIRLQGRCLLMQAGTGVETVEERYRLALDIARKQGAKSFEVRSATDLARFLRDQGKLTDARDLLAPIYGWFTEGFDTPVLQDAKALLDQLA